jgi:hypothetical protein
LRWASLAHPTPVNALTGAETNRSNTHKYDIYRKLKRTAWAFGWRPPLRSRRGVTTRRYLNLMHLKMHLRSRDSKFGGFANPKKSRTRCRISHSSEAGIFSVVWGTVCEISIRDLIFGYPGSLGSLCAMIERSHGCIGDGIGVSNIFLLSAKPGSVPGATDTSTRDA